jgi:signal transduction histidine kinase
MEIVRALDLTDRQKRQLELHSILNILNVLTYHLLQIARELDDFRALAPSLDGIQELSTILHKRSEAIEYAQRIEEKREALFRNLDEALDRRPEIKELPRVQSTLSTIFSVVGILEVRAREFLNRERSKEIWTAHSVDRLYSNFREVFAAIEQNSGGAYRIVYSGDEQGPSDYLVSLDIAGEEPGSLRMPAVFQDVFRDLLANARKYTSPGGHIRGSLREEGGELRLQVEDNGRGIPRREIEEIVAFGSRAQNAQDKRSFGGGYGLTKAYFLTTQFGGRMWIDSELDRGTTVTITVPRPG